MWSDGSGLVVRLQRERSVSEIFFRAEPSRKCCLTECGRGETGSKLLSWVFGADSYKPR